MPLSVTRGDSELRTARVTKHLRTNADVVKASYCARIEIERESGYPGAVRIDGVGVSPENAGDAVGRFGSDGSGSKNK